MCFLEYIGYTCGHISLPVLRPCPLTTVSHTFPTCPRRADKPFLAGEMCPTCQKIIHSRATQIEEYEHRFMHERGVCGCETVFPYLIRPRIIGGSDGDEPACDKEEMVPPILSEAVDAGGKAVVSVRLPSLYAAEWVADHRGRHTAGLCECRVDCRTYSEVKDDEEKENQKESIYVAPPALPSLRRVASLSSMQVQDMTELRSALGHQRRKSYSLSCSSAVDDGWAELRATGLITPPAEVNLEMADTDVDTKVTGYEAQPAHKGKPVRYSGAVFTKVPAYLPLTGPFLTRPTPLRRGLGQVPVVDGVLDRENLEKGRGPEKDIAGRIQKHVGQAMETSPLLGYPVGAGPEGVPHAAPWQGRPPCWK